jgi:hypothetical protein
MEDRKFDELTKKLAAPVSRRTALKAAVVTAIGGAFGLGKLTGAEAQTAPCVGSRAVACAAGQVCCTNPQALGMYGRCMSCPPGKVPNNFCQCVCPRGTTACGPGCVSPCLSGQVLNTQTCACTCGPGQTFCPGPSGTHTCVSTPSCPAGQFLDQTCQCQCSGSQPCGPGVCCAAGIESCTGVGSNRACTSGTCGPAEGSGCFNACANNTSGLTCYCVTNTEGGVSCTTPTCTGVACTTSADCASVGPGSFCFTQGCCGPPPTGSAGFCVPGCTVTVVAPTRRWGP